MSLQSRIDKELDIKGEVCPYTFVKTKLALETMRSGEILRILVDHLPATHNVPRSLRSEGHEVLEVNRLDGSEWEIVTRKK